MHLTPVPDDVCLSPVALGDLAAVNRVVEAALMTWDLAPRVKRLILPVYRYTEADWIHADLVAARVGGQIVGVACYEPADRSDVEGGRTACLLHGLYVDPHFHGRGVGRKLIARVVSQAADEGYDGLLVKANPEACGFFRHIGLEELEVRDAEQDYPHRFWLDISGADGALRSNDLEHPGAVDGRGAVAVCQRVYTEAH